MTHDPGSLLRVLDDAPPVADPVGAVRARQRRRRATRLAVAATTAAACVAVAGAAVVATRDTDDGAAGRRGLASITIEGIRMTLDVEPREVGPGDVLRATVTGTNVTSHPHTWASDPCRTIANLRLEPGVLDAPGRTWTGAAAAYKERALRLAVARSAPFGRADLAAGTGCPAVPRENVIAAGATITQQYVARVGAAGATVPSGTVRVRFTSALIGTTGIDEPEQVPSPEVRVRLRGTPGFTVVQAVDAALADPAFARWVARYPVDAWGDTSVLVRGRSWTVQLLVLRPETELLGSVTVDPATGRVVSRDVP